ncbi:GNAT family N-acetyltransferase [Cognatishimia sp. F0-27]|uniref:GNAT family N-acetyltransferase n=1 Tax=Cognatishimia sp. F0-27 TaxID=2816855 RepID=UPI001D0CD200|nr:GNAT family N-acetyltransferase [Cognatishimia sp. F0-27]
MSQDRDSGIRLEPLTGQELEDRLGDLAALRIAVFRDWPYLYDGDAAYERAYLSTYRNSPRARVVAAFDGDRMVGAATGTPLEDHAEDFAAPLDGTGIDVSKTFYCAESVLLPDYRGCGLGHAFFDVRENHARNHGFEQAIFAAVIRPENHPMRPENPRSLEPFWRKRGYAPLPGAVARFSWKDTDQSSETDHRLQIWMGRLNPSA